MSLRKELYEQLRISDVRKTCHINSISTFNLFKDKGSVDVILSMLNFGNVILSIGVMSDSDYFTQYHLMSKIDSLLNEKQSINFFPPVSTFECPSLYKDASTKLHKMIYKHFSKFLTKAKTLNLGFTIILHPQNYVNLGKLWKEHPKDFDPLWIFVQAVAVSEQMKKHNIKLTNFSLGNLFVAILDRPVPVSFIINDKHYTSKSRYILLLNWCKNSHFTDKGPFINMLRLFKNIHVFFDKFSSEEEILNFIEKKYSDESLLRIAEEKHNVFGKISSFESDVFKQLYSISYSKPTEVSEISVYEQQESSIDDGREELSVSTQTTGISRLSYSLSGGISDLSVSDEFGPLYADSISEASRSQLSVSSDEERSALSNSENSERSTLSASSSDGLEDLSFSGEDLLDDERSTLSASEEEGQSALSASDEEGQSALSASQEASERSALSASGEESERSALSASDEESERSALSASGEESERSALSASQEEEGQSVLSKSDDEGEDALSMSDENELQMKSGSDVSSEFVDLEKHKIKLILNEEGTNIIGLIQNGKLMRLSAPIQLLSLSEGKEFNIPFAIVQRSTQLVKDLKIASIADAEQIRKILMDYLKWKKSSKTSSKHEKYVIEETSKSNELKRLGSHSCVCEKGFVCKEGKCEKLDTFGVLFVGTCTKITVQNNKILGHVDDQYINEYLQKNELPLNLMITTKDDIEKGKIKTKFSLVFVDDCNPEYNNLLYCTLYNWKPLLVKGGILLLKMKEENPTCDIERMKGVLKNRAQLNQETIPNIRTIDTNDGKKIFVFQF